MPGNAPGGVGGGGAQVCSSNLQACGRARRLGGVSIPLCVVLEGSQFWQLVWHMLEVECTAHLPSIHYAGWQAAERASAGQGGGREERR